MGTFNKSIGIGSVYIESHHPYITNWYGIFIHNIRTIRTRILIDTGTHREENGFMDGIKYAVFTEKSIRLLENNQYTSNVESGSTRTEIKHWVELFFGVKVIAMNSHRLPRKGRRMGPIMGHTMHYNYRRMIITLQPGYYIPPLIEKRT
nr:ribosomal protein L23 [Zostera marina]YP_010205232.1 ribosomal protein L23 [Chorda filum]YP_010205251.1 ribosomal protein L23 [Chorda filum]ATD85282.1 ribosomal protein L23 [Zostera marina]UAV85800.1 ribosomal protein L23 [Chorda filum]UAV85819.1 ribosomal protein L23 [Chorda filum]